MKKIHYAWVICAGCTLAMFCAMGLTTSAFNVYLPYLIERGNLTGTQGSTIVTTSTTFALISMLISDKFHKKTDIRLGITIAVLLGACGFFLFGFFSSYAGFCIAAAFMGLSCGLGSMVPISILLNRWFHSHKALALGICSAGTGVAVIAVPPLATLMIKATSLSVTFFTMSAFIVVCAAIVFPVLRNTPEQMGLQPLSDGTAAAEKKKGPSANQRAAGKGAVLCMLLVSIAIGAASNSGFSHLSVLFKTNGYDGVTASLLLSFAGIVVTFSKCFYGYLTDKLGTYRSNFIFFPLFFVGLGLCCIVNASHPVRTIFTILVLQLGIPLSSVALSVFARDMSDVNSYGKTVKYYQAFAKVGGLMVGPVPGILYDTTGSYAPAYGIYAVLVAAALVIAQLSYRSIRKAAAMQPDMK